MDTQVFQKNTLNKVGIFKMVVPSIHRPVRFMFEPGLGSRLAQSSSLSALQMRRVQSQWLLLDQGAAMFHMLVMGAGGEGAGRGTPK